MVEAGIAGMETVTAQRRRPVLLNLLLEETAKVRHKSTGTRCFHEMIQLV